MKFLFVRKKKKKGCYTKNYAKETEQGTLKNQEKTSEKKKVMPTEDFIYILHPRVSESSGFLFAALFPCNFEIRFLFVNPIPHNPKKPTRAYVINNRSVRNPKVASSRKVGVILRMFMKL